MEWLSVLSAIALYIYSCLCVSSSEAFELLVFGVGIHLCYVCTFLIGYIRGFNAVLLRETL